MQSFAAAHARQVLPPCEKLMRAYVLNELAENLSSFMNSERASTTTAQIPHVDATLATDRHEFWTDTCREVVSMRIASKQVLELYKAYGCRFCTPSHEQVHEVLEALDSGMPHWEKEHPELFYQTLELNFPELVRQVVR
jgi:hypothetical protein